MGAGDGNVSSSPMLLGKYVPVTKILGRGIPRMLSNVSDTGLAALLLASEIRGTFCPRGPTSKTSTSAGLVW